MTFTDHLRSALSSRSVIDQAMGIIIGMQRCTPEAAFVILRTAVAEIKAAYFFRTK